MLGPSRLRELAVALGATLALSACSETTPPATSAGGLARITEVTDGDTLRIGELGPVRLIGVDAPELHGGEECFGREASRFVERLAPAGTRVRYRVGVEARDRYGRLLAYVWLPDGRMLNRALVEEGYAQPLTIPPNVEFAQAFRRVARAAREARLGLWHACRAGG